jgi:hypothetical protein
MKEKYKKKLEEIIEIIEDDQSIEKNMEELDVVNNLFCATEKNVKELREEIDRYKK